MWLTPPGRNPALKYSRESTLMTELRDRVSAYFDDNELSRGGGWRMLAKSGLIVGWAVTSYVLLLFVASAWWQFGLLAISLGLALAGIGFCIQHDGGHGAYSNNPRVSRVAAWALDFIGGSSYMWHHKHNVLHHTYPNVEGADDDISQAPWLRLSTVDEHRSFHRYQHWYSWFLYAIIPPKWILVDDFRRIFTERAGARRVPQPKGRMLAILLAGKAVSYTWLFVIPLVVHGPSLGMLAVYVLVAWVWGLTLATTFQLAHCTTSAEFSPWPAAGEPMGHAWAEQQLATTVNFAHDNPVVTWYIGGLNYQIEHHLFPKVCHLHYPALSQIVQDVCAERGVKYRVHGSVIDALRAHVVHLKRVGAPRAA
ncbi:MAG: acyl-CoA desaturase [Myxococcota bacterium]